MLTEEMIRGFKMLQEYVERHDIGYPVSVLVDTVLADAERLRAVVAQQATEIERLREVMEEYRAALLPFADCYQNEVPESDKALFKNRVLIDVTVKDLLRAAMVKYDLKEGLPDSLLDAKPDAAPAPVENAAARKFKVYDRVIVDSLGIEGALGTIVAVSQTAKVAPYRVHIDNMMYDFQLKESELELAVENIKVGDTVRIVSGNRKGEIGVVTDVYLMVLSEYTVKVVDTRGNEIRLRYERHEIEPA